MKHKHPSEMLIVVSCTQTHRVLESQEFVSFGFFWPADGKNSCEGSGLTPLSSAQKCFVSCEGRGQDIFSLITLFYLQAKAATWVWGILNGRTKAK